ncbi:MAG: hypothetical protein HY534_03070 [Chloroflexi bacterium]|nr:hypothetical protein [Chloroflexota bacterium]
MEDAHTIAQRARALQGRAFEDTVARILNEFVVSDQLVVVRGSEGVLARAIGDAAAARELVDFTKLPVKRRCTQSQLEDYPDSDLFVLATPLTTDGRHRLVGIINCKVSFHARHTETCFWGSAVRASSYLKYVCVTEDRDTYGEGRGRSELGRSCATATATRRLLESFTDRVYLVKRYDGPQDARLEVDVAAKQSHPEGTAFDDPGVPQHTEYCHLVRPLDDLIHDLRRWKSEVPQ